MEHPQPYYSKIDSLAADENWSWKREAKPAQIRLNGKRATFHPHLAYGTIGCMMEKALTPNTVVYWEIMVEKIFGTSIMFGVGRDHAQLSHVDAFVHLLGQDNNSYAISHKGKAYHSGIKFKMGNPLSEGQPCTIGMLFDGGKRQLSYFQDGIYIGTPFNQMDLSEPLYPMITSTAQRSVFRIQNQRSMTHPVSLFQASLITVHSYFGDKCDTLPIPRSVINSLNKLEQSRKNRMQILRRNSAIRKKQPVGMNAHLETLFRVTTELSPEERPDVNYLEKRRVIL